MDLPVLLHGELPGGNPEEAEPSGSSWARAPGSEVHVVQVADRIVSGMDSPLTRVSTGGRETGPLAPGLLRKRASPVKDASVEVSSRPAERQRPNRSTACPWRSPVAPTRPAWDSTRSAWRSIRKDTSGSTIASRLLCRDPRYRRRHRRGPISNLMRRSAPNSAIQLQLISDRP